jgi:hypothetical protein
MLPVGLVLELRLSVFSDKKSNRNQQQTQPAKPRMFYDRLLAKVFNHL